MSEVTRRYKIFTDFDGTITTKDVGESIFLKFGEKEEVEKIVKRWIAGEINSIEQWNLLFQSLGNVNQIEFFKFPDSIEIDKTFGNFVGFCKNNSIELKILSDGFEFYIKNILGRYGFSNLQFFSNKLILSDENRFKMEFPYTDEECTKCANCKRNHIIDFSSDNDFTVYIGDGYSDTCPAQYCDFVFAKNSLLKYCEINRITYFPFNNFDDVIQKMEMLIKKKRLKKRMQANLKRKEIYLAG